ncbi:putative protein kinase RLK-Pelle-DLSV family [Helianthus annuus]|nr:putative protein kinase RLK-Pelle-DLSV family [Helianthus annuus]
MFFHSCPCLCPYVFSSIFFFLKLWRYMAPEYLSDVNVSTKADVYSFGMLLLETITMYIPTYGISLLGYVEKNWLEGTLTDIIDPRIDVNSIYMTRFLEIGLLCIQVDAEDRPTMEEVVSMLDSSSLTLLASKIQAMVIKKFSNGTTTSTPVDVDDDYDYEAHEDYISELSPR